MMKELFYFMFSAYKRYGDNTKNEAYFYAILYLAMIRLALFFPLIHFCFELVNCKMNKLMTILYLIICFVYSYFRAPQKECCISSKKYNSVSKVSANVITFLIAFLSAIGSIFMIMLVDKYIVDPYGLEGWLLQFLPHINIT